MCDFAETAALIDVLEEDYDSLQERLDGFTDNELMTFFHQVRELSVYIETTYTARSKSPGTLIGRHRRQ